ncbi:MAG: cephalosporin hydroxylase family protein [Bacteroidia bacterium]|nr:cephalosporin hydroxylase family protein [Bacteroidia bacterium]
MNQAEQFQSERKERITNQGKNQELKIATQHFTEQSILSGYSYNFDWLGRPIIQYPQDIVALQELVWEVKPDLIIETGIAHGGSLILSASLLAMLDYCEAAENKTALNPLETKRKVLGIDIDIREHNKQAILNHPLAHKIIMIQGSSIDKEIVKEVHDFAKDFKRILICMDSNHTHEHVLEELRAYASLTSLNSYCIVFDSVVEDLPENCVQDRPWGKGNNPKTAVWEFLKENDSFQIDSKIDNKLLISVAPDGYLKRIK